MEFLDRDVNYNKIKALLHKNYTRAEKGSDERVFILSAMNEVNLAKDEYRKEMEKYETDLQIREQ